MIHYDPPNEPSPLGDDEGDTCPFCASPMHLGACAALLAYTDAARAALEGRIIAAMVQDSALAIAIGLADKLARVTHAPAHVVNDAGHPMLAGADDISTDGLHYWRPSQVIYTATPFARPLDVEFAGYGFS